MLDFFRKHTWLLPVILGLVVLGFVGGGVYQSYGSFMASENDTVAKVYGKAITRNEWDLAQRNQIERVRQRMPNVDAKLFDTPEMKRESLDAVIRDHVLSVSVDKLHLFVNDERLERLFKTDPEFAGVRNPNGSVNKDILAAQGMSSEIFAERLRDELSTRQVLEGITQSGFAPKTTTTAAFDAVYQQREVQVQQFRTKDFAARVSPTDAEIEAFYKDPVHAAQFKAPESANIEYAVLDLAALKKGITVSDKDLHDYYTANQPRYTTPEERRASHILVKVDSSASADDRAKAKAKAQALLEQVRKAPDTFADVARKNSDDPGSAEKGGDLDFFGHGGLAAKPLEDAAFGLKVGEISNLVQSDFGFHIVKLVAVRGGETRSFDAVRAEMEEQIKTQQAQKRYAEAAVDFTNLAYEQSDSLKPVVDKFKLTLQTAQNLRRTPAPGATGPLANAKLLDALFGNDSLHNKHNTEAVEVAPSTLVSARVVTYTPAHQQPLSEVRPQVQARLVSLQAAALARKEGQAHLTEWRAAPTVAPSTAEAAVVVSRAQMHDLPRTLVDAILKAPATPLPGVIGVDLGDDGYALVRITKVLGGDPSVGTPAQMQTEYARVWGDAESKAYYAALKTRYKVEISPKALTTPDSAASGVPR